MWDMRRNLNPSPLPDGCLGVSSSADRPGGTDPNATTASGRTAPIRTWRTRRSGFKKSGIGCEAYKAMMDRYPQTKSLLVSYSPNALGFI